MSLLQAAPRLSCLKFGNTTNTLILPNRDARLALKSAVLQGLRELSVQADIFFNMLPCCPMLEKLSLHDIDRGRTSTSRLAQGIASNLSMPTLRSLKYDAAWVKLSDIQCKSHQVAEVHALTLLTHTGMVKYFPALRHLSLGSYTSWLADDLAS